MPLTGGQTFAGYRIVRLLAMRATAPTNFPPQSLRRRLALKVVQKLLGHKTATLTLDRYGHLYPDDLDALATAFDTAADALRTIPTLNVVVSVGE